MCLINVVNGLLIISLSYHMKKFLLVFLFTVTIFTVHGQVHKSSKPALAHTTKPGTATPVVTPNPKPSKEETIKFMNDVLKNFEGNKINTVEYKTITFDGNQIAYHCAITSDGRNEESTSTYIFKWESYTGFTKENKIDDSFICLVTKFNSKIAVPINGKIYYMDDEFGFNIPTNKLPSFKKAILRLVEIAKEEHKDPFAN